MAKPRPITNISDPRWVRAISHPVRIRLLSMLEDQAASPKMLATQLEQPLGKIAYHVRTLYELGLLKLVDSQQRRGATEHYYRAVDHPRFSDEAWEQLDVVSKQRVLTAILDESHEYATRSAARGGFDRSDAHFTRTPLTLDEKGWTKLAKATKAWLRTAADIEQEAKARIATDPHSALDAGLVIQLFEAAPLGAGNEHASDHTPTDRPHAKRQSVGRGSSRYVQPTVAAGARSGRIS